jgi:hypothetical protein
MLIGWSRMRKLLRVRPKTKADRPVVDARPMRSREDIDRHVAKQEELRLALLEDYGRTLGY